jgi:hypothetical protein
MATSFNPSGNEQEMLELVNRMRLNPAAELNYLLNSGDATVNDSINFFKVDKTVLASQWSKLIAVQPLAWSGSLLNAAYNHNQAMIAKDTQSHQLTGEADLGTRITNAGYTGGSNWGENIYAYSKSVFHGHAGFAIDWGFTATGIQDGAGHRTNIMNNSYREVGISIVQETNSATSVGPLAITQDFGNRFSFGNSWLLGVAFQDRDADGFYDSGEGLGGVNVAIAGSNGTFSTTTMTAGGYQLQVPNGNYTVTFSGGSLPKPITKTTTIGETNVKVDATVGIQTLSLTKFKQDPSQFMRFIRDYDGNDLGGGDSWQLIGEVDVQGDGDSESIFINSTIGRWATVGSVNGTVDFDENGFGGDTRVVGIYIDPTLKDKPQNIGGPFDSQRRFQNDLRINNLSILAAADYNRDGFQDVYFKVNDGTAVLRGLMHKDGNIQYANYQSKDDLTAFMSANGLNSSVYSSWI